MIIMSLVYILKLDIMAFLSHWITFTVCVRLRSGNVASLYKSVGLIDAFCL
jgi:hypothetical protein